MATNRAPAENIQEQLDDSWIDEFNGCIGSGGSAEKCKIKADGVVRAKGYVWDKTSEGWVAVGGVTPNVSFAKVSKKTNKVKK